MLARILNPTITFSSTIHKVVNYTVLALIGLNQIAALIIKVVTYGGNPTSLFISISNFNLYWVPVCFLIADVGILMASLIRMWLLLRHQPEVVVNEKYMALHVAMLLLQVVALICVNVHLKNFHASLSYNSIYFVSTFIV